MFPFYSGTSVLVNCFWEARWVLKTSTKQTTWLTTWSFILVGKNFLSVPLFLYQRPCQHGWLPVCPLQLSPISFCSDLFNMADFLFVLRGCPPSSYCSAPKTKWTSTGKIFHVKRRWVPNSTRFEAVKHQGTTVLITQKFRCLILQIRPLYWRNLVFIPHSANIICLFKSHLIYKIWFSLN